MNIDTLSLARAHTLFRLPWFWPNVLFLWQDRIRDTMLHSALCLSRCLWAVTVPQALPVCDDLDSVEEGCQVSCGVSLYVTCLAFFSWLDGECVFAEDRSSNSHSQHFTSRGCMVNVTGHWRLTLITWLRQFVSTAKCLLFPPSHTVHHGR